MRGGVAAPFPSYRPMTAPRTVRGDIGRADSKELAMQQIHNHKRIALIIPAGVLFLSAAANAFGMPS
jgi:hypothetical protein